MQRPEGWFGRVAYGLFPLISQNGDSSYLLQFPSGRHFHSRRKPFLSILLCPNILQAPFDTTLEKVCKNSNLSKVGASHLSWGCSLGEQLKTCRYIQKAV